jgi:type IV pilus assembly protein PilA
MPPQSRRRPARASAGFTWIELMFVVAVIAILALMAIPGMQENMLNKQVKEGMELAELAKKGVQAAYAAAGEFPNNNAAAGIPPSHKIVGNMIREVKVDDGAITLTFGNNASKVLEGKHLTLRPAVVAGEPMVPIAWVCHGAPPPKGMEVRGKNETDIALANLPVECRVPGAK